jgi:protein-L-isoaspartate(D-aspartate) O-methyltransferase
MDKAQNRFYFKRLQMIEEQIKARDISDRKVIHAMQVTPRHLFVPERLQQESYEDKPLPIGYNQTISQPYMVALMTQELQLNADSRALEIGTGSGYQAAILSAICREVYSIEVIEELGAATKQLFLELGYTNIHTKIGDGYEGWPQHGPFDAIIITAAAKHIIPHLLDQLKIGGKIIMPLEIEPHNQVLIRITKLDAENNYQQAELLPVRFVPMVGQAQI